MLCAGAPAPQSCVWWGHRLGRHMPLGQEAETMHSGSNTGESFLV